VTRADQFILDWWAENASEPAGAAELDRLQYALLERFGAQGRESPASIARTLADNGVRLKHPEVLEADVRWREREEFPLFASDELSFPSIDAAIAWVENVSRLDDASKARKFVLQLKAELELVAKSMRIALPDRLIAAEVAHWLAVWLQNPPIFADWLVLRRESAEFRERFSHKEAQEAQEAQTE
jgi:hypothetical protein